MGGERRQGRRTPGIGAARAPVDAELDDEDEDEDFEELDDDELMPNMHFGLASRAALEAEEGGGSTAPNYIFLINAVVEGSAALTAR